MAGTRAQTGPPSGGGSQRAFDQSTVLGKAVTVLHAFTADDHSVSLAELARRTQMAKGTLHRIANGLVATGLLDRDGTGYRLGAELFQLGMRASIERSLIEIATPFLEDLYEHTHETVHLGVRNGLDVVYLSKIGGHKQVAVASRLGGRMPLHCTAIGKVLLAYAEPDVQRQVFEGGLVRRAPRTITVPTVLRAQLDQVAETGLAFEYEESTVGIACVAAPVTDADGHVVAAVSVTGPTGRFNPTQHRGQVRGAAAGISATLTRRTELDR
jgi:DNA-binding IclR family transcriptional regulator